MPIPDPFNFIYSGKKFSLEVIHSLGKPITSKDPEISLGFAKSKCLYAYESYFPGRVLIKNRNAIGALQLSLSVRATNANPR